MILDAGAVVLRRYADTDRGALVLILSDPEVMRLVLDERALTSDEAEKFLRNHLVGSAAPGFGTICLKATDEAIGFAGYRDCHYLDESDLEFGWVIAKQHHGRGYATALGEKLIAHALESKQLKRILAACNPLNGASEHVLRDKLNMRFERQVEPRPGFRRRVYAAVVGWRSLNGPDLHRDKNP